MSGKKSSTPAITRSVLLDYLPNSIDALAENARYHLKLEYPNQFIGAEDSKITVFFSFTDGTCRATVAHFSDFCLDSIFKQFSVWCTQKLNKNTVIRWLRVDWVVTKQTIAWNELLLKLHATKRNYFRLGIAFDDQLATAFLEQELNANSMLYLGSETAHAGINEKNFQKYGSIRYGKSFLLPTDPNHQVVLFTTQGLLVQADGKSWLLHGYCGGIEGRDTGRRIINKLKEENVVNLIKQSSRYLADQVKGAGRFTYGYHPCFDREIKTYNSLRHASTTYSMLEAWEVTHDSKLKEAIKRSITYLTTQLIRRHNLSNGALVAYLHDANDEIKLGGNAVSILVLVKYSELMQDQRHLTLLEQLALGIEAMQNPETGQFTHVLNSFDLTIKEQFRIIYYDGEAAFGLMRLYGLTSDTRWLHIVEKAFEYFIVKKYWKIHDHWLGYCVNELTLYKPLEKYYLFGIRNFEAHLDFVIERITTYPTLLELMMASHKMIRRLHADHQYQYLLKEINIDKFYLALETRARYLLNGFFWPEFAIYFQNPQHILGSFFIRHHSFRVRIDDVEHYLSGYVAYLLYYLRDNSHVDSA